VKQTQARRVLQRIGDVVARDTGKALSAAATAEIENALPYGFARSGIEMVTLESTSDYVRREGA